MTQSRSGHYLPAGRIRAAVACMIALGMAASLSWAQQPAASAPASTASKPPAPKAAATAVPKAPAASAATKSGAANPAWSELSPAQQQALKPLQANWASLSEAHRRKWLALSQNYPKMPPQEQAKLHSRMTEWAALSPRQRTEARLNFAEAKQHSPDEKKAKWQAYQALSPEEKQKLAAGAKPKPQGAAPAVKPVPAQKLAVVPSTKPSQKQHPAIAGASSKLDHNTLLPQPQPAPGTPAQSN